MRTITRHMGLALGSLSSSAPLPSCPALPAVNATVTHTPVVPVPSRPPRTNATAQQPGHAGATLKLAEPSIVWPVCRADLFGRTVHSLLFQNRRQRHRP